MKKIYLLILLGLLPATSHAAWWNFWFNQEAQTIQSLPTPTVEVVEVSSTPEATTEPSPTIRVIEKPVYKDRVVTNTVTVDNPVLIKQITDLTLQLKTLQMSNTILQDKYDQLQKKYTALLDKQNEKPSIITKAEEACASVRLEYKSLEDQKAELPDKRKQLHAEHPEAPAMVDYNIDQELISINKQEVVTNKKISVYCK